MNKLLLVIDYQVDFVSEEGNLTAGKAAQDIEQKLIDKVKSYQEAGQDVLCTLDTHSAEDWQAHPEGGSFNLHCEENSTGWQLYGGLADMSLETITKSSYMLDQTDIDWIVRQYDSIELAGVTTDICVLQNAIGLYNHAANIGKKIEFTCDKQAVASFDAQGHKYALQYIKEKLGFVLI